jgi:isopentenyl diphosphate isomerase/L-lactate dehydrogenase-like FMN-dependent dehydrogenase
MRNDLPSAFFSYSREDSEFALRLAADLKAAGADAWMDQLDIEAGQEWDNALEAGIDPIAVHAAHTVPCLCQIQERPQRNCLRIG